jgi:OmpA-OmpF porin, OOP family
MKNPLLLRSSLIVASALLVATAAAHAQSSKPESTGYVLPGAGQGYVGLNAGKSRFSLDEGTPAFAAEKRDSAYSVYLGGYFNANLGLEIGYNDFGSVKRAGGRTKADGVNINLVGRLPLNDSFSLLGKFGTTYGRTEVSTDPVSDIVAGKEHAFGVSYGIGAEFAFTPQWSAVLQYDEHDLKYINAGRDRLSVTTLGLRLRF